MWTYRQSTGELADASGRVVAKGYAGRGAGRNNPAMERFRDVGPLPAGEYEIGTVKDTPDHGPRVLPLTQVEGESYGRGGFLIHGDNSSGDASRGCVILPPKVRRAIAESADKRLKVVA